MNKTLLFALLLAGTAYAQPTYPASSYANAGESLEYTFADINFSLEPAQTGPNYTWDFSGLSPLTTETIGVINPEESGYKTSWCLANMYVLNCNSQFAAAFNLARQVENGYGLEEFGITNGVEHLYKSSDKLEVKMYGATLDYNGSPVPIAIDYTDPDEVLRFPLTYGLSYVDTSDLTADLNSFDVPITANFSGERLVEVDGWGDLQLPNALLTNVLRVHTAMSVISTIDYLGFPLTYEEALHSIAYYHPDYGLPVLQIDGIMNQDGDFEVGFARYLDITLSTSELTLSRIAIYPNPTQDEFHIVGIDNSAINSISIYNSLGQKVGNSNRTAHLSAGVYSIEIESNAGKFTTRLIKQ